MLHKIAANSLRTNLLPQDHDGNHTSPGPQLVARTTQRKPSAVADLIAIASRRCSSFFAEAAVLVLVFGILDYFLQRGHMPTGWVVGALLISVALLSASVATDFTARRWLGAHP